MKKKRETRHTNMKYIVAFIQKTPPKITRYEQQQSEKAVPLTLVHMYKI